MHNAVVLEEVAKMATLTELNNPKVQPAPDVHQGKTLHEKTRTECLLRTAGQIKTRVSETINQSNQAAARNIQVCAAGISAERKGNIHYDDIGITENGE